MSAMLSSLGGMLNVLVNVPRTMSPMEAREFLTTGIFPDLSQPPLEDTTSEEPTELTETDARLWLGTLTASTMPPDFDAGYAHKCARVQRYVHPAEDIIVASTNDAEDTVVENTHTALQNDNMDQTGNTNQTGTKNEPSSSPESTEMETAVVNQPAEMELL